MINSKYFSSFLGKVTSLENQAYPSNLYKSVRKPNSTSVFRIPFLASDVVVGRIIMSSKFLLNSFSVIPALLPSNLNFH